MLKLRRKLDDGTRIDAVQWTGDNRAELESLVAVEYADDGRPIVEMAGLIVPVDPGQWILRSQAEEVAVVAVLPPTLEEVPEPPVELIPQAFEPVAPPAPEPVAPAAPDQPDEPTEEV